MTASPLDAGRRSAAELLRARADVARALQERLPADAALLPAEVHVSHLATALHFGRSAIFLRHATWMRRFLVHRGVADGEIAYRLEALGGALLQHLEGPAAGAALHLVALALDAVAREPRDEPSCLHPASLQPALLEAVLHGDAQAGRLLVEQALDRGMPGANLSLRVLEPVLLELGRLWQLARIDAARADAATAALRPLLARAHATLPTRPARGQLALCACAPGETHAIGLQSVADFLERDGWSVQRAGPLEADTLLAQVAGGRPRLVALSATLDTHLPQLEALVAALRAAAPQVRILLGGRPFRTYPRLWEQMGADGTGSNAEAAAAAAAELMLG